MKKIFSLLAIIFCMAFNVDALTYEEAFDSIKALPQMKGVEEELLSGSNDFLSLGITDGKLLVWSGQRNLETAPYFNEIYKIVGQLPPTEMIQSYMSSVTGSMLAIFAKPVFGDSNRIIILADSAESGVTEVLIGYINNENLEALRNAILVQRPEGGTAIYLNAINF